jgi:hypothetical protein
MPSVRAPLLTALILSAAIPSTAVAQAPPVDWYTDTGGGGALAQPAGESRSGGAVAPPTATGPEDLPESDISATEPVSSPARASSAAGVPPPEPARAAADRPVARAAQDPPTVTGGQDQDQDSAEAGPIAALPLTGLELAGVAGAGLCLLVAGAALRPRRHAA